MKKEELSDKSPKKHRLLRVLLRVFVVILSLFLSIVIALNIPAVQTFLTRKLIDSIREKTGTEMSIGSVKIALPKSVQLNDIFIQDQNADTLLYLHSLKIDVDLFGLLKNRISVSNLLLEDVVANINRRDSTSEFNFQFILDALSSKNPDSTIKETKPWLIDVKTISLKNIHGAFIDPRSGTDVKISLSELEANVKDVDISKKVYHLNDLILKNTSIQLIAGGSSNSEELILKTAKSGNIAGEDNKLFSDLDISVADLTFDNVNFNFDDMSFPKVPQGIDYRHIHINKLNSHIKNVIISDVGLLAEINSMSFNEGSGFSLEKLSVIAKLSNRNAELKGLFLETNRSKISGDANLTYESFTKLSDDLKKCKVDLNFRNSIVNTDELFLFAPSLAANSDFKKFKNDNVIITAKISGAIDQLDIEKLEVSALKKTTFVAHGKLSGLPDVNKIRFEAKIDLLTTILPDLYQFIDPKSLAGLNLPHAMNLNGTISGKMSALKTKFQFNSTYGTISADAFYQKRSNGADSINVIFDGKSILAGLILADTTLGKANFAGKASALRTVNGQLYGTAQVTVNNLQYNSYVYKNIDIKTRINGDSISATISSPDPNVNFELVANADLKDTKKRYSTDINIASIDLHALNLSAKKVVISTNLRADLNYSGINNSEATLSLFNTVLSGEKKKTPIKNFDVKANSSPQGLDVDISSDLIDGRVNGNMTSEDLLKTLPIAFRKYFNQADTNTIKPGNSITFRMNVHFPKEVLSLIDANLEALEVGRLEGSYSSDHNELSMELSMPKFNYSGVILDSTSIFANGKDESLTLDIKCVKIAYKNLHINNFGIKEKTDHGNILSEISIRDTAGEFAYLFSNELEVENGSYKIKFLPNGLILAGKTWSVDPDNIFTFQKNSANGQSSISTNKFVFVNEKESFGIAAKAENQNIQFANFELQNLIDIADFQTGSGSTETGSKFIKGVLNGEINFPSISNSEGINVDLSINNLYVIDTLVGDLTLKMKVENDRLNLDARLANEENKVSVIGIADNFSTNPALDVNATIKVNNLHRLEHFAMGVLSEMNGKIDGEMHITGTSQKPVLSGEIGFDQAEFKVNSLNFKAQIDQEKILVSNSGFHFDEFKIQDANKKELSINGDLLMTDFSNYEFDLNLSTKDFQPINSTEADNSVFYGNLSLAADVNLKGDINSPIISANIVIDSTTNLTYALPGSELKLVTSEGVVQFLDSAQMADSVLAQLGDYMTDSIISKMKGVNLKSHIEIAQGARFTIDVDPTSGDYLTINGKAKLDISSDGASNQSINGVYEVNSGFYELSFYDLVKKKFTILPGSTIAWSGRPMDADLNITAEYIVRTTSVALVANETSGMSDEEKKIFNKRLPYEIKLNIRGLLSKPEISFNINLPNQYLSDNPLVETKLRQLNSDGMEAQLNKQVFALLVAGSFMAENPGATTGSSNNIASTAARNSVNGILASQLNNMSSKYISGVDVNFGLTSYEDYSSSTSDTRTEMDIQVSKKLFNDRLTVEAENSYGLKGTKNDNSGTASAQGYGQFAVIYSLTETGVYKLRAYYQNAYDPFDGDINYSGIAFIFEKEFDRIRAIRIPASNQPGQEKK